MSHAYKDVIKDISDMTYEEMHGFATGIAIYIEDKDDPETVFKYADALLRVAEGHRDALAEQENN